MASFRHPVHITYLIMVGWLPILLSAIVGTAFASFLLASKMYSLVMGGTLGVFNPIYYPNICRSLRLPSCEIRRIVVRICLIFPKSSFGSSVSIRGILVVNCMEEPTLISFYWQKLVHFMFAESMARACTVVLVRAKPIFATLIILLLKVNVTADHRIIYGADLAAFLQTFSKIVENPESLTL
ncbi:hypothetical protein GOBAR_DD25372 [Gossypium barbadense]|nr:hypothetical protein GOBAR_DD25372 [Gossypium barbadense]